jgi:hypothetical protein
MVAGGATSATTGRVDGSPAARYLKGMTYRRKWILAVPALLVLLIVSGCGDSSPPPPDTTVVDPEPAMSAEELAHIKQVTDERFESARAEVPEFDRYREVRNLLLKRTEYDLDDLPDPFPSQAEVSKILKKETLAIGDRRFPKSARDKVVAASIEKFPLYKVGDVLEVKAKPGGRRVEGKLVELAAGKIRVAGTWILRKDLLDPHFSCFDEAENKNFRAHHVRVNFDIGRKDFLESELKRQRIKVYRDNGYVKKKGGPFVSVKKIIETIEPKVDELEKQYYAKKEEEIRARIEVDMIEEGMISQPVSEPEPGPPTAP